MTWNRLLVGGLAFRTEAAALNDHRLAIEHQSIDQGCGQRVDSGHAPPGGLASLERAKAGSDECAVSLSIAGRSLLVGRNENPGDRRGEESCLLFRIADQPVCYENAVSPGSSHGDYALVAGSVGGKN